MSLDWKSVATGAAAATAAVLAANLVLDHYSDDSKSTSDGDTKRADDVDRAEISDPEEALLQQALEREGAVLAQKSCGREWAEGGVDADRHRFGLRRGAREQPRGGVTFDMECGQIPYGMSTSLPRIWKRAAGVLN